MAWLHVGHHGTPLDWINRLDANPITHVNGFPPMAEPSAARAEQPPWTSVRCSIQLDLQVIGLKRHHHPHSDGAAGVSHRRSPRW